MDTVQVSERFRKREFVLEYADNPEYPEYIKFELAQDRCELLDSFQPGQKVRVDFDPVSYTHLTLPTIYSV